MNVAIRYYSKSANIPLAEKEFHCKGSFATLHKGKPDAADIEAVKAFAKEITQNN